jgi:hypothetical protein
VTDAFRQSAGTALVLAFCVAVSGPAAVAAERVETIDGRRIEGKVLSITAEKVAVETAAGKEAVATRDLGEIVLAEAPDVMSQKGRAVVTAPGGLKLTAENVSASGGAVSFRNRTFGRVQLPVAAVSVIYLPAPGETPAQVERRCQRFRLVGSAVDMMILAKDQKRWLGVEGALKTIDATNVTFHWEKTDYSVSRRQVPAVRLARRPGKAPAPAGLLTTTDGSVVGFSSVAAGADTVSLDLPSLGKRKVPRRAVAGIRFLSDRLVKLSDLKPSAVQERGFFETKFPHRRNLAVSGKPLTLGSKQYEFGLGLHSFCELTYDLDGRYATFVALAGIDDAVRPHGDALLTVLGDGKELQKPLRLTGKDEPVLIRAPVKGIKKLTIRVDFGEDGLGVGDHVDLAAARLIE